MERLFTRSLLLAAFLIFMAFNIDNAVVPKEEILSGGVPKHGIPALLEPKFLSVGEVNFLRPKDQVMGVTGGVHTREIDGKRHTLGISGRLYKSNILLYDHQTASLWSQLMEKAIAGPSVGRRLRDRFNPNTLEILEEKEPSYPGPFDRYRVCSRPFPRSRQGLLHKSVANLPGRRCPEGSLSQGDGPQHRDRGRSESFPPFPSPRKGWCVQG